MTFYDSKKRGKLANIISKLPEEVVDSLYDMRQPVKCSEIIWTEKTCCPYCNGTAVVSNGHKCGKDCRKTFVSTTNTLMANSHQPREIWEAVIDDTLSGDAMVELIHSARCAGITARYVLFDSWFSAPKTMIALKNQEHPDTIAMVKKSKILCL